MDLPLKPLFQHDYFNEYLGQSLLDSLYFLISWKMLFFTGSIVYFIPSRCSSNTITFITNTMLRIGYNLLLSFLQFMKKEMIICLVVRFWIFVVCFGFWMWTDVDHSNLFLVWLVKLHIHSNSFSISCYLQSCLLC